MVSPSGDPAPDPSTQTHSGSEPASWMVGQYRILRKIGEGGMGVVYEAEQQHPKRAVALKVIRGGRYVDDHAVKLFERESQALARLKHPSIAAIYEAGHTTSGEHFFAMELVRGMPLPDYLRARAPGAGDLPARLRLFCQICEAVNYAHQRGVIHRDLKPANILVGAEPTSHPGSSANTVPEVKILDFGLARITDADVAATTVLTEIGIVQGTLAYMSPEQARGNPDEIDLRTDVYSLGVILFELLTGQMPYELPRTGPQAAVRVICEQRPRVATAAAGTGKLDRDLETIVLKALEKEPSRRYQSALALAEDIGRYMAKQPILARPASTLYQVRKLVTRHKTAFSFAAALCILLAAFAAAMAVQSARIARERDKAVAAEKTAVAAEKTATQVSSFLIDLFRTADPTRPRGGMTVREILDRGAARIHRDLAAQPLVQARLMYTLGRVYDNLGLFDQAQPLLETALAQRRELLGESHPEVASSLSSNGTLWFHKGEFAKAKPLLERALAMDEKLLAPDDPALASSLHNLGNLNFVMANYGEAQRLTERALKIREKVLPPDHPDTASTVNSLGAIAYGKGERAKARQLWERTLGMQETVLGTEHPHVAQTLHNLVTVRTETGEVAGLLPLAERVVRIQERTLGPKHPDLAFGLSNVAEVLMKLHEYGRARDYYKRSVSILEASGPNHPELGRFLVGLARATMELGDTAAARVFCRRSLEIREKTFGKDHPETAVSLIGLANCDLKERKYVSAEAMFDRALALCRRPDGQYDVTAADFLIDYAVLLRKTGRAPRAAEIEVLAVSLRKSQ